MSGPPLRVAIVGAGPSGLYAAEALTAQVERPVQVTVFDRLPTPFGLLRYGVAPDHVAMRGLCQTIGRILEHPAVTFAGGVEIGRDLTCDDLKRCFDARIFAYGASISRDLGIAGEKLPICLSGSELAAWYCGHPESPAEDISRLVRRARRIAVVGAGNVAIDVVRILSKSEEELAHTDMPDHVRDALAHISTRETHLIARRGPQNARFTTKELRELGELSEVNVRVRATDLRLTDQYAEGEIDRVISRNMELFRRWASHSPERRPKTIQFRFFERPVEITDSSPNNLMILERRIGESIDRTSLPVDLVVSAIGFRGARIPGLPLDAERGVVPNEAGRVLEAGRRIPGEYVTGWIRRGATGVVGTNKIDAAEIVRAVLSDASIPMQGSRLSEDINHILQSKLLVPWSIGHWRYVEQAERDLGARRGVERTTIHERAKLLRRQPMIGRNEHPTTVARSDL